MFNDITKQKKKKQKKKPKNLGIMPAAGERRILKKKLLLKPYVENTSPGIGD